MTLAGSAKNLSGRDVRTAAERACEALGRLGFQAAVTDASEEQVTITTPTCPLRPLVVAEPAAAAIDRGLWTGLVGAHLPQGARCAVSCETCDCLDRDASAVVSSWISKPRNTLPRKRRRACVPIDTSSSAVE